MRRILVAVPVCAMLMAGFAATAQAQGSPDGSADDRGGACNANLRFVYLAGNAKEWTVCLSSEGNVVELRAGGANHGSGWEGYRICSAGGTYMDLGNEFATGFGAPVITQPGGAGNITGLQISRTTTDGNWSLIQKFAKDNNERDFTITAYLRRLGPAVVAPVFLERWTTPAVDGGFGGDIADRSADSIYIRGTRAVTLTAGTYASAHDTGVGDYAYGDETSTCNPASAATPSPAGAAKVGRVTYQFGALGTNKQVIAKFRYQVK